MFTECTGIAAGLLSGCLGVGPAVSEQGAAARNLQVHAKADTL